ncbi:MAG: hypothetical protein HKL80_11950, partial [Acidimicrobiales bacterium]|nr:hypothetical protein [Acidimicrobiales bacterium]
MGILEKHHEKVYETQLAAWQRETYELEELIEKARANQPLDPSSVDTSMVAKRGEHIYFVLKYTDLVEVRQQRGHYQGGYTGFSFHVAKNVNYRVGGMRGHYVPGPELPTEIDSGSLAITDKRIVFQGSSTTKEWNFDKLIGYEHEAGAPLTWIHVSNRQKTSGIKYAPVLITTVHFEIARAVAIHGNDLAGFIDHLEKELTQQMQEKPQSPPGSHPNDQVSKVAAPKLSLPHKA